MPPLKNQAAPPIPRFDAETARRFLRHILDTSAGVVELRVFKAAFDRGGFIVAAEQYSATLAGWYDNVNDMIADLGKLRGVSAYVTVNPVNPDLIARRGNRIGKQRTTTTDADIVIFRWLYIDIDPKRPADISSTDAELAAAVEVRDRILADHPELAASSIWGRSGNGAWILVLLPDYLPEEGHDLAVLALSWISATYSDDRVAIDVKTKNPSRVGVIPGTVKCKGDHRPERPHRLATLDSPDHPDDDPLMPFDLRAWLAAVGADQPTPEAVNGHMAGTNGTNGHAPVRTVKGEIDAVYRASCYLDAKPPAISGQGGHDQTFDAACVLVKGFGLSINEARPILAAWNLRCVPPWSDAELEHKLAQADKIPDSKPRGYLLHAEPPGGRNRIAEHINGEANGDVVGNQASDNGGTAPIIPVPPASTKKSPLVQVMPVELGVNNQVVEHLHKHPGLYQRDYRLVEVAIEERKHRQGQHGAPPTGMPTIMPVALSRLREIISSVVTFRSGVKIVHPPDWCASAILHRQNWPGVPRLRGIVEHPVMRHDGSITNVAGHDEETEILCISDDTFLPPPDYPTHEEARAAARRIMAVVAEFPFHRDPDSEAEFSSHQAAWLACLMTILLRHLIDDAVPLFLIEATAAGSGKTLLCDLLSRIVTGRDMVRSAYYHDPVEMDKRITSTAMGGIRVTLMDNVSGAFGNSALDNALTARLYQGRALGTLSMTPPLVLDTVFLATGNNLAFHGDLFRRVVPCRLESPYERPDKDKTDFVIKDIRRHVRENRPALLRDAFTVARAYIQADRPYEPLPTNTYGDWVRLIQGMIVWVLDADPLEGQKDLAEADVYRTSRAALIEGFAEMLIRLSATKLTGAQVLSTLKSAEYADRFSTIREGMAGLWSHDLPSNGSLGKRLMNMRNARIGDNKLVKAGMNKRSTEWTLQQIDPDTGKWGPLRSVEVPNDVGEGTHVLTVHQVCTDTEDTDSVDWAIE